MLLRKGDDLETRVARSRGGLPLSPEELRVPRRVIHRALQHRRELLSMNFDPLGADGTRPEMSVAEAHAIIERVEEDLCRAFPRMDLLIHIDPEGHVDDPGNKLVEADEFAKLESNP